MAFRPPPPTTRSRPLDHGARLRSVRRALSRDLVVTKRTQALGSLEPPSGELLREAERVFRLMVESVRDYAIFMLDPTGRVATWSLGAQCIKGYAASEIIGQHFSRFYEPHEIAAGKCEYELEVAAREGRFEDEGWRLRKDGTRFWANVIITAVRNPEGQLLGFAKVTRDLTQRRAFEQQRIELAQAKEAVRLRDEFLSIVSHELRTPLAGLQMQLEALERRMEATDEKVAVKLQRASQSSERLANLVESLLDVSRLTSGRFALNRETFDIAEVVCQMVDGLRLGASKVGSTIEAHIERALVGSWDRVRIEQVVTNLVSNAIKYAGGRPIEVTLRGHADEVELEVRDHGPGIPAEHRIRIFERFERAASLRHYGGLGLGLYLVREFVHAHGGTVSASDPPGGGALFTVRLPRQPRLPAPRPPAPRELQ